MGAIARSVDQGVVGTVPPDFVEGATSFHGLAGRSPGMRQVIRQMERIAPKLTLALIEGEDGTGRTSAARALHAEGPAARGPFVSCLATHFFHACEANAEFGWSSDLFAQADCGMLVLDRVHLLDSRQQDRLDTFLHVWEDRRRATGANPQEASPQSVLAAPAPSQIVFCSSMELLHGAHKSHSPRALCFREDLASKLGAIRFRLPPLRERREDIPLLAQIFIQRFACTYGKPVRGLGPGTIAPLLRHAWAGNVRELEEAIVAACVQTESQWLRPIDLPPLPVASQTRGELEDAPGNDWSEALNLDEVIRCHVARVLERVRGNKLKAAQLLGISRSTLYRILEHGNDRAHVAS
jgi:DNA-binding NtrC family response regulator